MQSLDAAVIRQVSLAVLSRVTSPAATGAAAVPGNPLGTTQTIDSATALQLLRLTLADVLAANQTRPWATPTIAGDSTRAAATRLDAGLLGTALIAIADTLAQVLPGRMNAQHLHQAVARLSQDIALLLARLTDSEPQQDAPARRVAPETQGASQLHVPWQPPSSPRKRKAKKHTDGVPTPAEQPDDSATAESGAAMHNDEQAALMSIAEWLREHAADNDYDHIGGTQSKHTMAPGTILRDTI